MPTPEPSEREIEVYNAALELPGAERAGYLDQACIGDAALRQRVEGLLRAVGEAGGFLDSSAAVPRGPGGTVRIQIAPEMKPGDRIGRYKLLEQIGEGGCGIVYVAEQEHPVRRRVALKVIKLGMDTRQVIARFEAERQALALMDHPNIAKVLDAGSTENGRPFFVMELVKGISITRYCDEHKLNTQGRLNLFIDVCQAIQHAHQKGIIHRDVKPSNILVADHDGVAVPKVIDFGIAKATTDQRLTDKTLYTALEQSIGTPAYMSPEQANLTGLDIDTRSDIYSLGVLLYELLTGRTPFDAQDLLKQGLDAIRRTICEVEPPRPSSRLSTLQGESLSATAKQHGTESVHLVNLLRGDLDWIVMKCLEKDRGRRYETANELGADLKRHLNNEPVVARPPSASYKFQKAIRRNKLAFGAAAAVVLALLAGLTMAAMGWRQTRVERDKALVARTGEETQRKAAEASAITAQEQSSRAEKGEAETRHLLYVAKMNLVRAAWDDNNVGRVRQLLDETETNKERGFEWYYWQRQLHMPLTTLRGHLGSLNSIAYSPDDERIVTGGGDSTVKVWDPPTGTCLFTVRLHRDRVNSVSFCPDGGRIVSASDDHTAKVWEAATGKELLTLIGHTAEVKQAGFSPDGKRIVTAGGDYTARIWDAFSGKELLTLNGHNNSVNSVAYSPGGKLIVTGSSDSTARIWDAASGRELLTLTGHGAEVNSVAFSPDGRRIATGSEDNSAKLWEVSSGKQILTLRGHKVDVNAVAFSPNGAWIATCSWDQTAKVWDSVTGEELRTFRGHDSAVRSVAFSRDGKQLITGSGDWESLAENTAKVWDLSGEREVRTLRASDGMLMEAVFSPDGRRVVTAGGERGHTNGTATVWDTATGHKLGVLSGDGMNPSSAAFSPDGLRIVTASNDRTAKVWDAVSAKEILSFRGHKDVVFSAAFSPDGQRIVSGSVDKTAKVWDATSGKELLTLNPQIGRVWGVAFSPDGRRIVTCGDDSTVKVWDAAGGGLLLALKGHSSIVVGLAYSPDGKKIVTGSCDRTAIVWDAVGGQQLLTLKGHRDQVSEVRFSPDGQRIVTGSMDNTAKIWDGGGPDAQSEEQDRAS